MGNTHGCRGGLRPIATPARHPWSVREWRRGLARRGGWMQRHRRYFQKARAGVAGSGTPSTLALRMSLPSISKSSSVLSERSRGIARGLGPPPLSSLRSWRARSLSIKWEETCEHSWSGQAERERGGGLAIRHLESVRALPGSSTKPAPGARASSKKKVKSSADTAQRMSCGTAWHEDDEECVDRISRRSMQLCANMLRACNTGVMLPGLLVLRISCGV